MKENPDPQKENNVLVEYSKIGERPDTGKAYDCKRKMEWLQFKFNLGDDPFTKEQQD